MKRVKKIFTLFLGVCLMAGAITLPQEVQAAKGDTVIGKKAGWEIHYEILEEGDATGEERSVKVTKVIQNIAASSDTIIIPGDEYIYDAWETTRVFAVTSIAADAFTDYVGLEGVTTVRIEGGVTLEPGALNGLTDQVNFQTTSIDTKRALLEYGIPEERITYQGIKSNYVVFGDSISAGYALDEYTNYGTDSRGMAVGDAYPTPSDAFAALLKSELDANYGPAVLNNFSVSGSTSEQLLEQINRGDYDHALEDADIITITIGSNDLLGSFIDIVKDVVKESHILESLGEDLTIPAKLAAVTTKLTEIIAALDNIPSNDEYNKILNDACTKFIGTPETPGTQQQILDKITSLAPGAKIYWTTLYNPFYDTAIDLKELFPALEGRLQGEYELKLGKLAAPYIEKMNGAFTVNNTRYESVDLYETFNTTGITNVIISGSLKDGTFNLDPHPNTLGHQTIEGILGNAVRASYNPGDPAPDQSGAGDLLTFSLQGVEGTIDQAAGTVAVTLPYGTDVTDLAAVFTASDKAKVYVNDISQESGVTKNNFAQSAVYTVESEIGTRKAYTVNVSVEAAPKEPAKPQDSGNSAVTKKGQGGTDAAKVPVDTGDKAPVLWYMMLALASVAVMVQYFRKKERKGKRRG